MLIDNKNSLNVCLIGYLAGLHISCIIYSLDQAL